MLLALGAGLMYGWKALLLRVPLPCMIIFIMLLFANRLLGRRSRRYRRQSEWQRSRRLELEAYSGFELTLTVDIDPRKLAEQGKRVCKLIAEKSCYPRSAFFLRNAAGNLVCVGSCGMDDLTLGALEGWGERIVLEEGTESGRDSERRGKDAVKSFSVVLKEREVVEAMPQYGCHIATIVPLRLTRGRLVGAIAVCADGIALHDADQAIAPLVILAGRLAGFGERAMLVHRLMEVERMAVSGHIGAGVAREISHSLTTLLALAETMATSAIEPHAQRDAAMILSQALKMRAVLFGLQGLWEPGGTADEGRYGEVEASSSRDPA